MANATREQQRQQLALLMQDSVNNSMQAWETRRAEEAHRAEEARRENEGRITKNSDLKADVVGFFDLDAKDDSGHGHASVGKTVIYKDVFVFIDRLKQMAKTKGDNAIREVLPSCLRNRAQLWLTDMTDEEKDEVMDRTVDGLCKILIKAFKKQSAEAIADIRKASFTLYDVAQGKDIQAFVNNIFRDAKASEMPNVYNQLSLAWAALDFEIQLLVDEPSPTTTRAEWLQTLNKKIPPIKKKAEKSSTYNRRETDSRSYGKNQPFRPQHQSQYQSNYRSGRANGYRGPYGPSGNVAFGQGRPPQGQYANRPPYQNQTQIQNPTQNHKQTTPVTKERQYGAPPNQPPPQWKGHK